MSPNPHLPPVHQTLTAAHTRQHREECGVKYYLAALELAQCHWQNDKPAQALLQLNKAFMADLLDDSEVLKKYPPPYVALVWFLKNRPAYHFIGNPVRHFQHLATRISGPRAELRAQRAWACFYIAKNILPSNEFPPDEKQLAIGNISIPAIPEILNYFHEHRCKEADILIKVLKG